MSDPDTLDVDGIAALLKCSPETARELCATQTIPATKIGSAWVAVRADIVAWLSEFIKQQHAKASARSDATITLAPTKPTRTSLRAKRKTLPDLTQYSANIQQQPN